MGPKLGPFLMPKWQIFASIIKTHGVYYASSRIPRKEA